MERNIKKLKRSFIIFLSLLILTLISISFEKKNKKQKTVLHDVDSIYKSNKNVTVIYSSEGFINYRLTSQHIEYLSKKNISWFTKPVLIIYSKNKIPMWSIKSDVAKLVNDCILNLQGNVVINALSPNSQQLCKITIDRAKINLNTQYVTSQDTATIYGTQFCTSGSKIRVNLRNKKAELIEKVKASYEIKKN